jgi:hypothetical protein
VPETSEDEGDMFLGGDGLAGGQIVNNALHVGEDGGG